MPVWLEKMWPILLLLVVVGIVIARLPRIELGHSDKFRHRRVMNWLPLGLLYAFLYMGRYNLTVSKDAFGAVMDNEAFAIIFGVGTAVYGASFLVNGPLTDRIGGKKAILIGAAGSCVMNLAMGLVTHLEMTGHLTLYFAVLYGLNMYFQSFGAVAIIKVNAPWFHVRERGVFGAIFGILISLGIYFAFDINPMVVEGLHLTTKWMFFLPAILLAIFWVVVSVMVKNTPGEAGHDDFDTADASSGDEGPQLSAVQVFKKMFTNPIIVTIAAIEFCSGFLRQAIMQWYRTFSKQVAGVDAAFNDNFVVENWGMLLCCAGILGGVVAGVISDRVFQSRRGPAAGLLYCVMLLGAIVMVFVYDQPLVLGPLVVIMSMAVIGVHGMLSGTASMDFGGKNNAGIAAGIIDGCVYAGTAVMSLTYGLILPNDQAAKVLDNWWPWPVAMIPVAAVGLFLSSKIWNAKPQSKKSGPVEDEEKGADSGQQAAAE